MADLIVSGAVGTAGSAANLVLSEVAGNLVFSSPADILLSEVSGVLQVPVADLQVSLVAGFVDQTTVVAFTIWDGTAQQSSVALIWDGLVLIPSVVSLT